MLVRIGAVVALIAFLGAASMGVARADCEDDMVKLDEAMKTQTLTQDQKTVLQDAKKKAVAAVKKDDDETCNKVISEAMTKVGLKL